MTVRARRLLAGADVVVRDRLAPEVALPDGVEVVEVGKTPRGPSWSQRNIERVLVDRRIHDDYLHRLVAAVSSEVRLGDPLDGATTMGPLNNERTAAKTEHQVAEAIERGATLHAGGHRAPRHGSPLFFEPTILDRVTETMEIAREETFGPEERFRLDERLHRLNELGYDVEEIFDEFDRRERRAAVSANFTATPGGLPG